MHSKMTEAFVCGNQTEMKVEKRMPKCTRKQGILLKRLCGYATCLIWKLKNNCKTCKNVI